MKVSRDLLWPEGVTWSTSVDGRVLTYVFAHNTLGEIGRIVIRPVDGGMCSLECQYDGSADPQLVRERKARLINLGELITLIFAERHRETARTSGFSDRRTH